VSSCKNFCPRLNDYVYFTKKFISEHKIQQKIKHQNHAEITVSLLMLSRKELRTLEIMITNAHRDVKCYTFVFTCRKLVLNSQRN